MEFGVFDHLDLGDRPHERFYRERLEIVEAYERAGFYSYHVAEHHLTPLGMAPSPSVFLAAVAQRTKRLRFGPMVTVAPLYHPLRLLEEICMLDQMSGGRLEMAFGRGALGAEVRFFDVDPGQTEKMHEEAVGFILEGLREGAVTVSEEGGKKRRAAPTSVGTRASRFFPRSWESATGIRGRRNSTRSPRTGARSPAIPKASPGTCGRSSPNRARAISSGNSRSAT